MAKIKFNVDVFWDQQRIDQVEVVIDAPDNLESKDSYKVAVTMLGVEDQIKNRLRIVWSDSGS